jgi:predicted RNase H-like HicB family nuclease
MKNRTIRIRTVSGIGLLGIPTQTGSSPVIQPAVQTGARQVADRFYCSHEYYVVGDFMVARKFTVFLEPAEEGGFIVKCGELPVATQGETREEALKNIKEAIEGYLEVKAKLLDSKIKGEKAEVIVEAPSTLLA